MKRSNKKSIKVSRRKILLLVGVAAAVLLLIVMNAYGFYKTEFEKKPIVQEKIASRDVNYLYNFYVRSDPNIAGRPYYGNANASITMIVYMDVSATSSTTFVKEVLPSLQTDYINTGKMKIIFKNYLFTQDALDDNANYEYAKAVYCVGVVDKAKYYDFLFKLIEEKNLTKVLNGLGIEENAVSECMKEGSFEQLKEDISEADNFGIVGISPRFYIGVDGNQNTIIDGIPSYSKIKRSIREYQLMIGD